MREAGKAGGEGVSRAVRGLRWGLYAVLLAAAAGVLLVLPSVEQAGPASRATAAVAVALLVAFVVGYAAYRFLLVRAGRYPAGKAFVQVALVLAVVVVVVGLSLERRRAAPQAQPVDLARPLRSGDADARAMAAELARHRDPDAALALVPRLIELLDDPSPEVRRQAHASLVAIAGRDVGGSGAGAAGRWDAWWAARAGPTAPSGRR
jgi:hypothetical protein